MSTPGIFGVMQGNITMPTTSSNCVYYGGLINDTFGPAFQTNNEMTGFYCDGTNNYYLFNAESATTGEAGATNGYKLYVTNINGTGFGAVNYGQLGAGAPGFNIACGLTYNAGKLYGNIIADANTHLGIPATSNAICVFETNGICDGVFLLGQQPRSLQNAVFLSNGPWP